MSWRSPWTVPMTAVCSGFTPLAASSGSSRTLASFMACAAMSISGTYTPSLQAKRRPTSVMASVMASRTTVGSTPSSMAAWVKVTASARLPASTAAVRAARSAMGVVPPPDGLSGYPSATPLWVSIMPANPLMTGRMARCNGRMVVTTGAAAPTSAARRRPAASPPGRARWPRPDRRRPTSPAPGRTVRWAGPPADQPLWLSHTRSIGAKSRSQSRSTRAPSGCTTARPTRLA